MIIPPPKEKKPKINYLLDEDVELIRQVPVGMPYLFFFRHTEKIRGGQQGKPFGEHRLWKAWENACDRLGIEGVDLYGGTKHSTAMAMRQVATFEEARSMTGHSTNKAFERYFRCSLKSA